MPHLLPHASILSPLRPNLYPMTAELDPRDREILRLAGADYRYQANREQVARERFGFGSVAFWAAVNRLLDDPRAELAEPDIVHRLGRLRHAQRQQRRAG